MVGARLAGAACLVAALAGVLAVDATPASARGRSTSRPRITYVSEHRVPLGGARVLIEGANLHHVRRVMVGRRRARHVHVDRAGDIWATLPRESAHSTHIRVVTKYGRSRSNRVSSISYTPPPVITGFSPRYVVDNHRVTITGRNFVGETELLLAGGGVHYLRPTSSRTIVFNDDWNDQTIRFRVRTAYGTSTGWATVTALGAPVITTTQLSDATVGTPYSATLRTGDGRAGAWRLVAGTLPPGLGLDGGRITGTPTAAAFDEPVLRFTDLSGQSAQTILTIFANDSSWSPAAPDNLLGPLNDIDCPVTNWCAAIGAMAGSSPPRAFLAQWANGSWSSVPMQFDGTPVQGLDLATHQLSCAAPGECAAIGAALDPADDLAPVLATLSDDTWSVAPAPLPDSTPADGAEALTSVSCGDPGSCTAVGYQDHTAVIDHLASGSWTPADKSGEAYDGFLRDVSCVGDDCAAVGTDPTQPILMISGASTTPTEIPGLPSDEGDQPVAVSCTAATDCTAVGGSYVDTSSGADWTGTAENLPDYSYLKRVACTIAGCLTSDPNHIYRWTPTSRVLEPITSGPGGTVQGIGCNDQVCAWTGISSYGSGGSDSYVATLGWSTATATVMHAPEPDGDSYGRLGGVACPVGGSGCVAVGGVSDATTRRALVDTYTPSS